MLNESLSRSIAKIIESIAPLGERLQMFAIPRAVDIEAGQITLERLSDGGHMVVTASDYVTRRMRTEIGRSFRTTIDNGRVSSYYDPRSGRVQ